MTTRFAPPPNASSAPSRTPAGGRLLRLSLLIVVGVLLVLFLGIQFIPVSQSDDLAYRLGQMLARGGRPREPGRLPEGQFQPPSGGQQPPRGQFPSGGRGLAGRFREQIESGQMPPATYTMIHPDAKLADAERQQLIQGLAATLGQPVP